MSQLFASGGQSIGVSASASVLPGNIHDWFPLRLTGLISLQSKTFSSLLQHHSSKASILQHSAFFMVQLSHPYGKTVALTRRTFVGKVMGPDREAALAPCHWATLGRRGGMSRPLSAMMPLLLHSIERPDVPLPPCQQGRRVWEQKNHLSRPWGSALKKELSLHSRCFAVLVLHCLGRRNRHGKKWWGWGWKVVKFPLVWQGLHLSSTLEDFPASKGTGTICSKRYGQGLPWHFGD